MASMTATDLLPVLKEVYPNGDIPKELQYGKSPLLAMMRKDTEEAHGEHIKIPVKYGNPQGVGAVLSTAQTNNSNTKWKAFEVDTIDYYGVVRITGRAIAKAKNDRGSFVRALKAQSDGIVYSVRRRLSHNLFRNHGGAIGQIATSGISSDVVTLTDPRDTRFFEPDMVIKGDTTDGTSGTVHAGSATVESVSRSAGTVTATAGWVAGIGSLADADYLFVESDFGAMMYGLRSWIPATDPSSTSFLGVDRSVDPVRLGGCRDDLSGIPIEEAAQEALRIVTDEGGEPDVLVLSTNKWTDFAKALGSKVEYGKKSAYDAEIGFKTIKVMGPAGEVDVIADPDCQSDVMWALSMDSWTVYSMGEMIHVLDDDGMPVLREAAADGVEMRVVARPQVGTNAPGHNGAFEI
jgi:hypothetical protein